jgi:hypothetical protein
MYCVYEITTSLKLPSSFLEGKFSVFWKMVKRFFSMKVLDWKNKFGKTGNQAGYQKMAQMRKKVKNWVFMCLEGWKFHWR